MKDMIYAVPYSIIRQFESSDDESSFEKKMQSLGIEPHFGGSRTEAMIRMMMRYWVIDFKKKVMVGSSTPYNYPLISEEDAIRKATTNHCSNKFGL